MALATGTLEELLKKVTDSVRSKPADASARMQLFRLLLVTGQWERADNQLDVAGNLDKSLALTVLAYRHALACERFRREVFAGSRSPLFLGEPDRGSALLAQSLMLQGEAAQNLRAEAIQSISPCAGTIDGHDFEWLCDADSRIGPMFEAYIDGKYYWVPFNRVQSLRINIPTDVLDLVWVSAELTVRDGATQAVLLPARYPGSESCADDALRMSRRTDWTALGAEQFAGLGQRMFATDQNEYAMLDTRFVEFRAAG